jgi:hypothetical protein
MYAYIHIYRRQSNILTTQHRPVQIHHFPTIQLRKRRLRIQRRNRLPILVHNGTDRILLKRIQLGASREDDAVLRHFRLAEEAVDGARVAVGRHGNVGVGAGLVVGELHGHVVGSGSERWGGGDGGCEEGEDEGDRRGGGLHFGLVMDVYIDVYVECVFSRSC